MSGGGPATAGHGAGGERGWDPDRWLLDRELFGIRPGLDRMRALLARLGDPQRDFDAVHVVGSNGKTSTVTFAAALLRRRGLRVGAYVSPHLVRYAERIQLDGAPLDQAAFAAVVADVRDAAAAVEAAGEGGADAEDPVTQFEAITAAALLAFARSAVDCAVIEAGLGGRWDATNVLPGRPPAVAVLTGVALEHTRWLGSTLDRIAREKVEVLKPGGTLVLAADLPPEALAVAEEVAGDRGARIVRAPADPGADVPTPGARYQRRNLATAAAAVEAQLGGTDPSAVRELARSLVVPGRFETVEQGDGTRPTILHDGAHNAQGMAALADALGAAPPGRPLVALVGVLDDKDPEAMLAALAPVCDVLVLTAPRNPRALPAERLAAAVEAALRTHGPPAPSAMVVPDPHEALREARTLAGSTGTVLATGSLHLVADLRRGADAGPGAAF